jgi:hypothetical protein
MRTQVIVVECDTLEESPLRADYPDMLELPEAVNKLILEDQRILDWAGRNAWAGLTPVQRVHLLVKSRKRAEADAYREHERKERDRICGAYVRALTEVGRLHGEERDLAKLELDRARTAWFAIKGKKRP